MGSVELNTLSGLMNINAQIILYGNAANELLAKQVAADIELYWNEPAASIVIRKQLYKISFIVEGIYAPALTPIEVYENTDPRKNYFRVESYAHGNISFVDGIHSNTGYFLLQNLVNNSTTAAHEYGHTIGLLHPADIDIRGRAVPGIMYPRGTIVDPHLQYDPQAVPGKKGGTMNPFHRRVLQNDIENLQLHRLKFSNDNKAVLGGFSSVWHEAQLPPF